MCEKRIKGSVNDIKHKIIQYGNYVLYFRDLFFRNYLILNSIQRNLSKNMRQDVGQSKVVQDQLLGETLAYEPLSSMALWKNIIAYSLQYLNGIFLFEILISPQFSSFDYYWINIHFLPIFRSLPIVNMLTFVCFWPMIKMCPLGRQSVTRKRHDVRSKRYTNIAIFERRDITIETELIAHNQFVDVILSS